MMRLSLYVWRPLGQGPGIFIVALLTAIIFAVEWAQRPVEDRTVELTGRLVLAWMVTVSAVEVFWILLTRLLHGI